MRLAALALFLLAGVARGSMPPIPLPAWIHVDLAMARPPELDRPAVVTLTLTALVGALPGTRYDVNLPEQLEVAKGARSGTVDLAPGKPHTIELQVVAKRVLEGGNVSVEVTSKPPASALSEAIDRAKLEPQQREAGLKLVKALPAEDVQRRILGLTVSADEGILAEAPDPAYRRLVKAADGALVFLVLDALPGVDGAGLAPLLAELRKKLDTFKRLASGRPDDPLQRFVNELTLETAKLRYQQAVLALAAGKAAEARAALEAVGSGLPPSLENARRHALACAKALAGDLAGADADLAALVKVLPPGRATRYAELARAEVQRKAGRGPEARAAYERALAAGPSLTLARRRAAEMR